MTITGDFMDFTQYPKRFTLENGQQVTLRPMRQDDRDRLFSFFRSLEERDRRYFKHDVTQREVITNWCANLNYDRILPILALVSHNDREIVVADATLHAEQHGWSTHVASIRLVVAPDYKKKGLGLIMLRELYDRAVTRGVEKIQSMVRDDDENSLRLLKTLGFKKEAEFVNHAVDTQGRKHNVVVMYNDLSDLWKSMEDLNIDYDFHVMP